MASVEDVFYEYGLDLARTWRIPMPNKPRRDNHYQPFSFDVDP
jgi:hypothetical protein